MLSPYTVIDLTDHRGELASMVMGDMGSDVIKVEPPEGSASRRMPPFLESAPEPENSLNFFAFNRNKRSITLDLHSEAGRRALLDLVAKADFVFESAPPGEMEGLGLGFDDLRQRNSRLVYVAITAFGQDGPYSGYSASDLTLAAMGGQMALQGQPDRPPVRISVPQVWLHASVEAVVGAMTAHARMINSGEAQFVDLSAQAAMVFVMLQGVAAHAIQGFDYNRAGSNLQLGNATVPVLFQCADGYVVLINTGATMSKLVHWLVDDGIVPQEWIDGEDWPTYERRFLQSLPVTYSLEEVVDATRRYTLRYTKAELLEKGSKEDVTLAPVSTLGDLTRFKQLEERGFWLAAPLPDGSTANLPGIFAKLSETPLKVERWAPTLGQHNQEVLGGMLGLSGPELDAACGAAAIQELPVPDQLPFEGLKVADFSWVGVGPITAKYLADHGATVVRVETEGRPDILRIAGPFKDGVSGPNRSHFYGDFNTSKFGLSLDLKNPVGHAVARRLIEWADVYIESFTPGTMDSLGIGYETARSLNPSVIMVSTCLMGQTGPAAHFGGYGFHAGAIAGFFEITGWPGLPPDGPWVAYTDTVAPRFLASAVMAALDHRRRTGQSQHIDAAQIEMGLQFLAPQIADFNASGHLVSRSGNRSDTAAPHGAYPCAGDDQWCAIAVETEEQWMGMRRALDDPPWAAEERFQTAEGRLSHQDELDEVLGRWTAEKSAAEVMELLQSQGVPAGVVQRSSDLLRDPQLAHRSHFHYLDHPEMGNVPYTGHQFKIRGYDSGPRFPAPLLGQHNEHVLKDILGMTDEDITEAVIAGALT